MGIFDRIKQSVKGTAEGVVRGMEERNPDAVYEAAIDGQIASVADLKDRVARLMVERDREAERIAALEREEVQLAEGLRGALAEDDDDTALVLQVRREEVADELVTRRASLEELAQQVREGQAGIVAAKEGTEGLKREKDVMLAQRAAADAALQIQDAVSGVGADPTSRALASVREAVGVLESRAHAGYLDEEGNSVRGRAEAMGRKASEQSARDQLAALKRQLGKTDDEDADER
ncbi:MAG: hypothetical protein H6738_24440 [Alphaproteobacteria bacterium]|nr:hypothetical protein [Alphaproteobacteria bacterium]MCB9699959.1 hypothetical protein [Alphaproteobacteria bacterium]